MNDILNFSDIIYDENEDIQEDTLRKRNKRQCSIMIHEIVLKKTKRIMLSLCMMAPFSRQKYKV